MKTIIYVPLIIIVLILLAALSGCDDYSAPYGQSKPKPNVDKPSTMKGDASVRSLRVFRDPETNCEYLSSYGGHETITPRMGRDGKQVCR